jgi:putative aminopeptidase FrvX
MMPASNWAAQGGNVFARFKGTVDAPPLLLSAHLDTVSPTTSIQIVRTENEIKTDGRTILGADNKAGVAIILEVLQTLQERHLPHPPLEVVFSIREEKGLLGAKAFDASQLRHATGWWWMAGRCPATCSSSRLRTGSSRWSFMGVRRMQARNPKRDATLSRWQPKR